jgi:predicted  nucleic acid-binding Zn-ribbon protein
MDNLEGVTPHSSLGERLLTAVQNLWTKVIDLDTKTKNTGKVVAHQAQEIEVIKKDIAALRAQIHGLKVSRGRALAKNTRLQQQIAEAERTLVEAERRVH